MDKTTIIGILFSLIFLQGGAVLAATPQDRVPTSSGDLVITFVGHGALVLSHGGKVVHVDPWGNLADYSALPDADVILITHEHRDHLDAAAIAAIRKDTTVILANAASAVQLNGATAIANGESRMVAGLTVQAVPAYNLVHMRSEGVPYHPRGDGNGYVIAFGGTRVYIAGDTENVPEMKGLGRIDVAFMPVNLPYTMTPEMLADAARMVLPSVLYPYHTGETDTTRITEALRAVSGVEVRLRPMK